MSIDISRIYLDFLIEMDNIYPIYEHIRRLLSMDEKKKGPMPGTKPNR